MIEASDFLTKVLPLINYHSPLPTPHPPLEIRSRSLVLIGHWSLRCALEYHDLPLMIRIMLQQPAYHRPDGHSGPELGIALIAHPA